MAESKPPASKPPMSALPPTAKETAETFASVDQELIEEAVTVLVTYGINPATARAIFRRLWYKGIFLTRE